MKYTFKALPIAALSMAALLFSASSFAQGVLTPSGKVAQGGSGPSITQNTSSSLSITGGGNAHVICKVSSITPSQQPLYIDIEVFLNGKLITKTTSITSQFNNPSQACPSVVISVCDFFNAVYPEGTFHNNNGIINYPLNIRVKSSVFGQDSETTTLCLDD